MRYTKKLGRKERRREGGREGGREGELTLSQVRTKTASSINFRQMGHLRDSGTASEDRIASRERTAVPPFSFMRWKALAPAAMTP